jgi:hypothetical protein
MIYSDVEYSKGLTIQDVDSDLAAELEGLATLREKFGTPMDLIKFYPYSLAST